MITKLFLQNFKSWHELENVRLAPITGFFGSNSSGKTSILQLLLMLKQTAESSDRTQVLNLGDDRSLVELGTFKDIIYNHVKESLLKCGLTWDLRKGLRVADPEHKGKFIFEGDNLEFQTEIEENGAGRIAVDKMGYSFASHYFGMEKTKQRNQYKLSYKKATGQSDFKFKHTVGRVWDLPSPVKCYGFPDQVKAYYQNAGFLSDIQLAFEELFSNVYYLGPLREYPKRQYTWAGAQPADMGQRGEKVIDAILASRERNQTISRGKRLKRLTVEEYVAHWLRELGMIYDFSVKPITEGSNLYRVWVRKSPNSADVLITDVGFGVSQILPVITLCYYVPEGSTILMEQPEIHLHPTVQAGLADVFVDAIKTRKVQIVLESHSEHLLRRLQRRIAEKQFPYENAVLYFCEMVDGHSRLKHLDIDLMGRITNWPDGFFGDEFGEMAATTKAIQERKMKGREN
jgi:predicted ATPase